MRLCLYESKEHIITKHSSHSEWVLDLVVSIDQHARGFAGDFLRFGAERLQVVSAFLAEKPPAHDEMAEVGEFLTRADHTAILSVAYDGSVPTGMRRALRRIGSSAQDHRCYGLLRQLLADPPHPSLADCIYRLTSINRSKLLIARLLPDAICRPNVIEAISDVAGAGDVAAAYNLLVKRGVDADALAEAICKVRSERDLMNLWHRWLMKAECPAHPIPGSDAYAPISSGEELNRLSLHQFRNCASKRYLLPVMSGEDAMAVFSHEGKSAMIHLRHSEGCWRCEGAYGPRNALPPSSLREALYAYLESHGVVTMSSARRKPSDWDALRRLVRGTFNFDFET